MKSECRTAVEGVLGRKLTDKETDLLEQQFIKASREIPQEDINEEKKKWDAGNVSYMETLINVLNKRFDWLDKEYFKV